MNGTGGLLQKTAAFIARNPIVLLPVMATRLLDFGVYWVCGTLKGPALKAVAPRSVLGGFSGKLNVPTLLVAAFFTFLPLVCEVALLVWGMAVSGRWAHQIRHSEGDGIHSWRVPAADVARVATITLALGAITAMVGLYFTLHGGVPARWTYLVTWCFLIMAGWFTLPSWLALLAKVEGVRLRDNSRVPPFVATALGFAGFAACVYAGGAVQRSLENSHRIHGLAAASAINLVAACFSAIPLAVCFVALSRYVAERPGWQSD